MAFDLHMRIFCIIREVLGVCEVGFRKKHEKFRFLLIDSSVGIIPENNKGEICLTSQVSELSSRGIFVN